MQARYIYGLRKAIAATPTSRRRRALLSTSLPTNKLAS